MSMTKRATFPLFVAIAVLGLLARIVVVFGMPTAVTANSCDLMLHQDEIHYNLAPLPFPIHDNWTDWETWEASPDVIKAFPYYKMGYDMDGLVVYYVGFGQWDYRHWAQQSEEKVAEFWKYFEQNLRHEEKDAVRGDGGGIVEIIDFDGFNLSNHASARAIKLALTVFAAKQRMDRFVRYGFFVNVNFSAEMFINSARPFLSNYIDKFELCGTRVEKCKPLLLKQICADQLIPKLGGSPDWKSGPFNP